MVSFSFGSGPAPEPAQVRAPEQAPTSEASASEALLARVPVPVPVPVPEEVPDSLTLDQVVNLIEQLEYRQRGLDAIRTDLLSAAVQMATADAGSGERELAYRSLRAELATVLGASERVAESQLDAAWSLRTRFAITHEVLSVGEISAAHARVIVDAGQRIGAGSSPECVARREAYQREVLSFARQESVNRLRPIARRIAEQYAVESLDERHREEVRRRRVVVQEREDGMSGLWAYLPTVEAYAIHDRLTRIAREVERAETAAGDGSAAGDETAAGDENAAGYGSAAGGVEGSGARRARDEIRADVFTELLLGAEPSAVACSRDEAVRARVQVVVPVTALEPEAGGVTAERSAAGGRADMGRAGMGRADGGLVPVAELSGAGPIAVSAARSIAAATALWERVVVDAESGAVLQVDRYRPSEQMRRLLAARDQHCRFPGCRVPLSRCDLDHTIDAARGGATSTVNLAHLCRGHHVLKHHTEWKVRQKGGGDLLWTSPTGRTHADRPPSRVRFAETGPPGPGRVAARSSPDGGWHPF